MTSHHSTTLLDETTGKVSTYPLSVALLLLKRMQAPSKYPSTCELPPYFLPNGSSLFHDASHSKNFTLRYKDEKEVKQKCLHCILLFFFPDPKSWTQARYHFFKSPSPSRILSCPSWKPQAIPCLLVLCTHQAAVCLAWAILVMPQALQVIREAQGRVTAGLGDKEKHLWSDITTRFWCKEAQVLSIVLKNEKRGNTSFKLGHRASQVAQTVKNLPAM